MGVSTIFKMKLSISVLELFLFKIQTHNDILYTKEKLVTARIFFSDPHTGFYPLLQHVLKL